MTSAPEKMELANQSAKDPEELGRTDVHVSFPQAVSPVQHCGGTIRRLVESHLKVETLIISQGSFGICSYL